jgi:cytoskeletal protein CcmA (bactofilin family)
MFGKKETSATFSEGSTTLVSKNTEIVGEINFSGNLMIEGKVTGNVYVSSGSDAHARVLEKGIVVGEIRVPSIVINGTVNGDVYSDKHVELAAKAIVNGNVHYNLIEMVKGAQVNGNLVYSAESTSPKPTLSSRHADKLEKASTRTGSNLGSSIKASS